MKTTLKFSLTAIIAVAVLFSSCGKYEDGPKISLASKKSRLVNTWKLVEEIQNGVVLNLSGYSIVTDIKKDGSYTYTYSYTILGVPYFGTTTGTWQFSSDKESLIMTPNGSSTASTATILRLKSKELWTKQVVGTDTYEDHYEQN